MAEIVVSEFMDESAVENLRRDYDLLYDPDLVNDLDKLAWEVADARALIVRNRTQVRGALLEAGRSLRVIGRLGVGLDNIDLEACAARKIAVEPATGANNTAVAEYVIGAALLMVRGAFNAHNRVMAGEWPRGELIGGEIAGRTLGLIGFGGIAREVAVRAQVLGMNVQAHDPLISDNASVWGKTGVLPLGFEPLLAESNVVSVHVPLMNTTHHLIGETQLAAMRPDTVLINTSRGGVVDDAALACALNAGKIAGAVLDVFETEPLPAGSVFDGVPNLVLTPHIAGVTRESNARVGLVTADNVRRVLENSQV